MKRSLRKQIIAQVLSEMEVSNNGLVSVEDVARGFDGYPSEWHKYFVQWLDENCSNGHYSRWTLHGEIVYDECDTFGYLYSAAYKSFE